MDSLVWCAWLRHYACLLAHPFYSRLQPVPGDPCMDRMLNRATPMLKAVGTKESTVVFKPDDNDENEDDKDDDQNA